MFRSNRRHDWTDNGFIQTLALAVIIVAVIGDKTVKTAWRGGRVTVVILVTLLVVLALWLR